jgi:hypothetical protein
MTGGNAYCWGDNTFGQLGDGGSETSSATPVLVAGGYTWADIYSAENTCARPTSR